MFHDPETVREFAQIIESLEEKIGALNSQKSGVFKLAKKAGLNGAALRVAVRIHRQPEDKLEAISEHNVLVDAYLDAIRDESPRAGAREGQPKAKARTERPKSTAGASTAASPA